MSAVSVNGARVASGSITIPMYGAWSADVVLAADAEISSPCTLVAGDLSLVGTVVRQAGFAGGRTARIVAGGGGWRNELPARGYSHIVGVRLSSVLGDAARECGETISVSPERFLGAHYGRERAKAERVLHLLLDGAWWIDSNGITQMSTRDASPIVTPFTVVSYSGARGQFEIASEALLPWQPGRTFTTNTVPIVQTISSTTIEVDNDGKLRLHVLSTDVVRERLRTDLRSIIRAEVASLSYAGTWEYTVAPNAGIGLTSAVDCTPTDSRMPPLTGVPLVGMGAVIAPPITGTSCRIRFVNCDPTRPECISMGVKTEHLMTTESTALLIYNTLVALMALAGGGPLLAAVLQPFLGLAITTALTAQVTGPPSLAAQLPAAVALQPGFAAGTVPSPATFAAWDAVIALPKALNVSGSFPGVGVPNGAQ